ncbi:MAG: hypothetical protein NZ990_02380 [Myxococcota bacterium]|nr:hypothetical protein [Myxococcota bacterium]
MTAEDRAEIEAALENEEAEELLGVIIDIALAAEDLAWAESCLLRLVGHPDTDVRGNALMAFAQLAARLGEVDRARVAPALAAGLGDEAAHVREQAEACLEELGWRPADGE